MEIDWTEIEQCRDDMALLVNEHVVRAAGRRRAHDLKTDAPLGERRDQARIRQQRPGTGAEKDDLGIAIDRRGELIERQRIRTAHGPVVDDQVRHDDDVPVEPRLADLQAPLFPGYNDVGFCGFSRQLHCGAR
jgi:hypothetical protein